MAIRLFYALMPSEEMVDALQAVMGGVSGARWQTAAQLHLTLRFVGEVPAKLADELAFALVQRLGPLPSVSLHGVGHFEKHNVPDTLWIGVRPAEPIASLHRKFDHICQTVGLEPERRAYVPHITVARLSRGVGPIGDWIAEHAGFSVDSLRFPRCSLVQSVLTKHGSYYEELASVPLT